VCLSAAPATTVTGEVGAQPSGLCLIVRPAAGAALALPLSSGGCVAVAGRLLDEAAGVGSRGEPGAAAPVEPGGAGTRASFWSAAALDPSLAAWIVVAGGAVPGEYVLGAGRLVERLPQDLVAESGLRGGASHAGDRAPGIIVPDEVAWRTLAAALSAGGGPSRATEAAVCAWGGRIRRCLDADGGGALPGTVAPPAALRPEAEVLLSAIRLAAVHERIATGFAAEVEAARFEGLRSLAYGAGHEINNPLANIAARGQALLVGETDPQRRRRLATIVDQAFRARDMIGGLMLCARPPVPQAEKCDVVEMTTVVLKGFASRAAAQGVHVVGPVTTPTTVWVDRAMIEEAIRAVVGNALDAMPGGGSVTIRVDPPGAVAERPVEIHVDDDGPGMDGETRRAAFDPFFSGREAGRGIGFGLAKARRFVVACGGAVEVGVSPSGGTRVTLRLPAPQAASGPGIAPHKPPKPS